MRRAISSLALTALGACVSAISDSKPDVTAFQKRRDAWDHFRSEEPVDADRANKINEEIRKYCPGTDRDLLLLKDKYKDDARVMHVLSLYEEHIEL